MNKLFALPKMLFLFPVLALSAVRANAQAVQALESIKSQEELNKAVASLDGAVRFLQSMRSEEV